MELAMVNDLIVGLNDVRINAHDRGLFFGDGVYEVVLYWKGRLFAMARHLQRLEEGLRKMEMLDKVDLAQIEERVNRAVEEANMPEAMVYFHLTRGRGLRGHDWAKDWQPNFLLTVRNPPPAPPETATAITHPDWRWKRCDIKSLNLLANVLAKNAATRAHAFEAILVDDNQLVTEASLHTVLLVRDGVLQTAPLTANILPSITRGLILERAEEAGLQVREESFTVDEALAADELMIAGTTVKLVGITQLDDKKIADGKIGPYTRRLRDIITEMMEGKYRV
ncbi:aminotransferase class IV [Planctomycetota bacterium]